jgi:hypothetical protein
MAFSSLHWKENVDMYLDNFTEKAKKLAEEYNDPYSIKHILQITIEEYEKFLMKIGPLTIR